MIASMHSVECRYLEWKSLRASVQFVTQPHLFSARGRLSLDTVVNARGKAGEPAQCPLKNNRAQRWARIGPVAELFLILLPLSD